MRVIREIEVGGRKVLIKELTLGELRVWLASCVSRNQQYTVVDEVFADHDLLVGDIPEFCDLAAADLEGVAPSELAPVVQAIREVNERFFVIWRLRLAKERESPLIAPDSLPELLPA